MDKEKIKKTLKGIGLTGLIAGIGLMASGCNKQASASCGHGSCGTEGASTEQSSTSCGHGSCGQ